MIVDYNIGKSFTPVKMDEMVRFINELKGNNELHELYHKNSLAASEHHTIRNVELITGCYV
jgi:hypothetical protein